ncbi:MAG: sensor histidine kinase, partial [Clostridiales bacterium]|nr:sensor histidine kinase [Clostridiales bacterium]
NHNEKDALEIAEYKNITFDLLDENGEKVIGNTENSTHEYSYELTYYYEDLGHPDWIKSDSEYYAITIYINDEYPLNDVYRFTNSVIHILYSLRYAVYLIGVASAILIIICFVFLMCAAGRRKDREDIVKTELTKVPFDIVTLLIMFFQVLLLEMAYIFGDILAFALAGILTILIWTVYSMSFAVRVKLGTIWKDTVIAHVLKFIRYGFRRIKRGIAWLGKNISLTWKVVLLTAGVVFLEMCTVLLALLYREPALSLVLWMIEHLIFIILIFIITYSLVKLKKGAEVLVEGDLSYKVDTSHMFGDFKRHGENLNSIAVGLNHAVEDRMKSERLKTELITNVSHDIKTPLTSIINYSDLITKEETDNPAISEYAEVLFRQSERLKKLIEDLMEASKAVTGNIEVQLLPCEVGVLLTQTVGEYAQRMHDGELQLITKNPQEKVQILADGRLLWRVFDNLMNNICKYAQDNTRVYLSVEKKDGRALISFKNISRSSLDIPMEELMERFVRGDKSRGTEGNGLGLSIAKNLVELQGGNFDLTIDGDLFKVVLDFPIKETGR